MKIDLSTLNPKLLPIKKKPYEIVDSKLKGFLLRVQPSGIMTYYLTYRNEEKKRTRIKIGKYEQVSIWQARGIAEQTKKQLKNNTTANSPTLLNFIKIYYEFSIRKNKKNELTTINRIKSNFKHLMSSPITSINETIIKQWQANQLSYNKSNSTINRDIAALKAILRKAFEWQIIKVHPLKNFKFLKVSNEKKIRYLTDNEENKLISALNERELKRKKTQNNRYYFTDNLKPLVLLAINTGLKRTQLLNLMWKDINFDNKTITTYYLQRKHLVPLNRLSIKILKEWFKQSIVSEYVFIGKDKKPLKYIPKSWLTTLKNAEIKNFTWNDLHDHFGYKLINAGVNINVVKDLLGYKNISSMKKFLNLTENNKREAVNFIKVASPRGFEPLLSP